MGNGGASVIPVLQRSFVRQNPRPKPAAQKTVPSPVILPRLVRTRSPETCLGSPFQLHRWFQNWAGLVRHTAYFVCTRGTTSVLRIEFQVSTPRVLRPGRLHLMHRVHATTYKMIPLLPHITDARTRTIRHIWAYFISLRISLDEVKSHARDVM